VAHTFTVRSIDAAGNTDATPATYSWVIDTIPPDTAMTGQPSSLTNQVNASFALTSTEAATFECQIDNGAYAACTSPAMYTNLASNVTHTFTVRSTDAAGNTDATPATYSWVIDTIAPNTAITSQPENPTNKLSASFVLTSTEAAMFECRIDNGQYTACMSPASYGSLASNVTHTFSVRSTDSAGNIDATPATYSWLIDTRPVVAGLPPDFNETKHFINVNNGIPSYLVHDSTVQLSFSPSDTKGMVAYYASENPDAPDASAPGWKQIGRRSDASRGAKFTFSEAKGTKTVYLWFKDAEGNVSEGKSDTIYYYNENYILFIFALMQIAVLML
jgi:hypothetical protein